jgi:hypothetical protein
MRLIISIGILAVSALPALADRPVTEDERARLSAAVQAEGCSGGKFELDEDDQQFEVDDAVCADGKKYDLKFDRQMRLKRKNLDWEVAATGDRCSNKRGTAKNKAGPGAPFAISTSFSTRLGREPTVPAGNCFPLPDVRMRS